MRKLLAGGSRFVWQLLSTKLNVRLIFIFIICFIGAIITFLLVVSTNTIFLQDESYLKREKQEEQVHQAAKRVGKELVAQQLRSDEHERIEAIVSQYQNMYPSLHVIVADKEEFVSFITEGKEQRVRVQDVLLNKLGFSDWNQAWLEQQVTAVYPVSFQDKMEYVLAIYPYQATIAISRQYNQNALLALVSAISVFLLLFFLFMRPITRYIEEIEAGIRKIVQKDWDYGIQVKGRSELSSLAANINWMAQQLKERFQRERELEQSKNELITNVSHDLRTPLTSIIGYVALLKDGHYKDKKELQQYLQTVYHLSEKLKYQIQELFEYTKLASPDIQIEYECMELGGLLQQFVGEYVPIFEKIGLQLQILVPDEPVLVQLDVEKFIRVLDNILSNAEKYSHKPSEVTVQLQCCDGKAKLSVTNATDHIPEEVLPKLFQRLYRLDIARSKTVEGSGIGLATAKRIVELHHGSIWAESKQDDITIYIVLSLVVQ